MVDRIAICATSCRFPDADSPVALWQNLMDRRLSFRALPTTRINLDDYARNNIGESDSIVPICAGLLHGWTFDRSRFKISQTAFDAADLTHWLALDLAAEVVSELGGLDRIDRDRTAVVIGNTLTGEFSRATQLRMRLPFLNSVLSDVLRQNEVANSLSKSIRETFSDVIWSRFSAPNEETLAGGLTNTIAGRIANYFDFHGGAYTVDAACASSLVAFSNACDLISNGRADSAIVGAVDLSLDPFELIGFSRNGALAVERMRVFDERSSGFWPGEGGGFALLMREEEALQKNIKIHAIVCGWGISTDGTGGLTRPSVHGQVKAIERALKLGGLESDSIGYVEAHGTGTAVGDQVEITALEEVFSKRKNLLPFGSVKSNIGHTKASAGFAGLIKVVESLKHGIVPPHVVGRSRLNSLYPNSVMQLAIEPVMLNAARSVCGVSSFGFGGVNCHVLIERAKSQGREPAPILSQSKSGYQEHELFLFRAVDLASLARELEQFLELIRNCSVSEMADVSFACWKALPSEGSVRVALVASRPDELLTKTLDLLQGIREDPATVLASGIVGQSQTTPKIGLLFPGQSAPVRSKSNAWFRRFASLLSEGVPEDVSKQIQTTEIAQPAIFAISMVALRVLENLGVEAIAALGHSLGEISALVWSGRLERKQAMEFVSKRGNIMATHGVPNTGMMNVQLSSTTLRQLGFDRTLEIACVNSNEDTVLAGPLAALDQLCEELTSKSISFQRLHVSHAFHSKAMLPAQGVLEFELNCLKSCPSDRRIVSSVTGSELARDEDLSLLLSRQLTTPVLFSDALSKIRTQCDLLVEVGPGQALTRLATSAGMECIALDACSDDLKSLMYALAKLFTRGVGLDLQWYFEGRSYRDYATTPLETFLSNPCNAHDAQPSPPIREIASPSDNEDIVPTPFEPKVASIESVEGLIIARVCREMGLPPESVDLQAKLLADLHLSSISVGRIVADVAGALQIAAPTHSTDFATATVGELVSYMRELKSLGVSLAEMQSRVEGVRRWVRTFERQFVPASFDDVFGSELLLDEDWRSKPGQRCFGVSTAGDNLDGLGVISVDVSPDISTATALWKEVQKLRKSGRRHLAILHRGLAIEGFGRCLIEDGVFLSVCLVDVTAIAGAKEALRVGIPIERFASIRAFPGARFERVVVRKAEFPADLGCKSLTSDDVVLVTGGAKGIGAECALFLARRSGAKLVLIGRSPSADLEVQAVLNRAREHGSEAHYVMADVSDFSDLESKVRIIETTTGPVTAILHAAAVNIPASFDEISDTQLFETFRPKITGIETLLNVAKTRNIGLFITFGTIISHLGLAGEAHYALANSFMSKCLADSEFATPGGHAACRNLSVDWSVWSGVGMGERLGAVERLEQKGVDPITLDFGLGVLEDLVFNNNVNGTIIVSSRLGQGSKTGLPWDVRLPNLRFLERILVHTPGVEIVAEVCLDLGTDFYLADHLVQGLHVVPGAILLEAMAQAAGALLSQLSGSVRVRNLRFDIAVVATVEQPTSIRISVLHVGRNTADICIRSSEDNYSKIHASATIEFNVLRIDPAVTMTHQYVTKHMPLNGAEYYNSGVFFGARRFAKVDSFDTLCAFETEFVLSGTNDNDSWFSPYHSQELVLGSVGHRDAGLHGLLALVPNRNVIPVDVREILIVDCSTVRKRVKAKEVWSDGTRYKFDILWLGEDNQVLEVWRDATFQAISMREPLIGTPKQFALLLEREVKTRTSQEVRLEIVESGSRAERSQLVLAQLGLTGRMSRGDGKPETQSGVKVSISHTQDHSIAGYATGVDVFVDLVRPEGNPRLKEADKQFAKTHGIPVSAVWAAREAEYKSGNPGDSALGVSIGSGERFGVLDVGDRKFIYAQHNQIGVAGVLIGNVRFNSSADAILEAH